MRSRDSLRRRSTNGISIGIVLLGVVAALSCSNGRQEGPVIEKQGANREAVQITILYDNNEHDERLETAWGFSCLVEGLEKTILFDTGGSSALLLSNMRKLGIDPALVDAIVISHVHGDHVGGLAGFLEKNHHATVYLPRSLPKGIKETVRESGAELVEVREPINVCRGAHSTGELDGGIKEQSLLVETSKGIVLITGCAHPGIVNIVRHATEQLDTDVYMALGGFHLSGASAEHIRDIVAQVKALGVQAVAPCHCSGDVARKLFKEAYGENYYAAGVGWQLTLGKPERKGPEIK